jgi:four helix bundle protein
VANGSINSYKDLAVWQKAIALSVAAYHLTKTFPKDELYGMTSQIRRASVSVAANIAEGHWREQTKSFVQFLRMSQGSLKELETHLVLAELVHLADGSAVQPLLAAADELGRMLRGLIRSLQAKIGESDG